jgi:nitroreductase / dihydropteridine reductase
MELRECVMQRYATKKFDGKKIPEKKVDELLDLVRFAPSALNLQPWKIKIVTDQKTKEDLKGVSNNQEQVTTCSHLLVFCADTDYDSLIKRLGALLHKNHVPVEVAEKITAMAAMFAGSMTKDQRAAWSQAQTYLALGNALNGAKALGFDSCPMGGFDPAGYTRILDIPKHLVPVMLCPIGYAADAQGQKIRYERDEIVF